QQAFARQPPGLVVIQLGEAAVGGRHPLGKRDLAVEIAVGGADRLRFVQQGKARRAVAPGRRDAAQFLLLLQDLRAVAGVAVAAAHAAAHATATAAATPTHAAAAASSAAPPARGRPRARALVEGHDADLWNDVAFVVLLLEAVDDPIAIGVEVFERVLRVGAELLQRDRPVAVGVGLGEPAAQPVLAAERLAGRADEQVRPRRPARAAAARAMPAWLVRG